MTVLVGTCLYEGTVSHHTAHISCYNWGIGQLLCVTDKTRAQQHWGHYPETTATEMGIHVGFGAQMAKKGWRYYPERHTY